MTAFCNREANASFETCSAAGVRGLHNGLIWLFVRGVLDYDNVHYSFDGGEASNYLSLRDLGRGRHALRVNELQAGGWTGWSAPYTFTIVLCVLPSTSNVRRGLSALGVHDRLPSRDSPDCRARPYARRRYNAGNGGANCPQHR